MFGATQLLVSLLVASGLNPAVCYEEQAGAPASTQQASAQTSSEASQQTSPAPAQAPATPISGYMDFHLNKPVDDPAPPILDFHRFVLLFTHQFSDRIRFVGELELEHAVVEGLEEGGELELEQAYLDFMVDRSLNFRAGMLLMPL